MRKFLVASLLALPLSAVSQQKASAWSHFNFSGGFNISYDSGGNRSLLWGAYRSYDSAIPNASYNSAPTPIGGYMPVNGMNYDPPSTPQSAVQPPAAAQTPAAQYQPANYPTSGYMPVGYYQDPGYGYYQVPAYWYGR